MRIQVVVTVDVPTEVGQVLLQPPTDEIKEFSQHVYLDNWTYHVHGPMKWTEVPDGD